MPKLSSVLFIAGFVLLTIYVYNAFIAEKTSDGKNLKTIANLGAK